MRRRLEVDDALAFMGRRCLRLASSLFSIYKLARLGKLAYRTASSPSYV